MRIHLIRGRSGTKVPVSPEKKTHARRFFAVWSKLKLLDDFVRIIWFAYAGDEREFHSSIIRDWNGGDTVKNHHHVIENIDSNFGRYFTSFSRRIGGQLPKCIVPRVLHQGVSKSMKSVPPASISIGPPFLILTRLVHLKSPLPIGFLLNEATR
jgi:hypothetical protein